MGTPDDPDRGGYLTLVLHAHLPFVRHPEHEDFLEEDWFYEAITETYLPLLEIFDRLADEGIPFRITLTLTPTLVAMLRDELLISRYARKLERLCSLAEKEVLRTREDPTFKPLARYYREHLLRLRAAFRDRYDMDLVGAFKRLQDAGHLEIMTSAATHGFLPLMQQVPEAARAQISIGAAHYRLHFGRDPAGIWLPECGYYPGVERFLADEGIRYFFLDTHGVLEAQPRPVYGVYAPLFTELGVAAFGRDPESSQQVWSSHTGYPGDPVYREFYRDIGWDLPLDYIRPFIQPTGDRKNTGLKYYRITGKTEQKEPYQPELARHKAAEHAGNFLFNRERQIEHLAAHMRDRPPLVVAPYDAELFGHWWFEGPWFLEFLLRKLATQRRIGLVTPTDYLVRHPANQVAQPPMCSWGEQGYSATWLHPSNDWVYPRLLGSAQKMVELARDIPEAAPLQTRALNQAARELLLAQSSDWAFIMRSGTMVDYAVRRTKDHLACFSDLEAQLRGGRIDEAALAQLESRDNLFPELDYRIYRPLQ